MRLDTLLTRSWGEKGARIYHLHVMWDLGAAGSWRKRGGVIDDALPRRLDSGPYLEKH
jgi:hypothetical protein